ncbi:MAG: GTP-sensing pleiotropic transcriptional regulator CodY [Bacillota bacterium]
MKESQLLEHIKRLNSVFLRPENQAPIMNDGVKAIAEITSAAVLVINKDGKILAGWLDEVGAQERFKRLLEEGSVDEDPYLPSILKTDETMTNGLFPNETGGIEKKESSNQNGLLHTVVPIKSSGKNIAVLLLFHPGRKLEPGLLILSEMSASLIGMLIIHQIADQVDQENRNRELAEGAFESLSYSEVEAIREILKNINNNESVVVASKIADSLGITRSVIVNALRKFESAGIIESRSLGMKGTFIRVKNIHALEIVASRSEKMGYIR